MFKVYIIEDPENSEYEFDHLLIMEHNGIVVRRESDAIEPEDVTFYRDLAWVEDAIEQAYQIGKKDMLHELNRNKK